MNRYVLAASLVLLGSSAYGQEVEVLGPQTGTEFVIRCGETGESRWFVASNNGDTIRVERVGQPGVYRQGPVWAYILGDIYEELGLGTGKGSLKMTPTKESSPVPKRIAPGTKYRGTYNWVSPTNQAERTHTVSVRGKTKISTPEFGEQEVYEVRDDIFGPLHDNQRTVMYAPGLRMYVTFSMKNNRTDYELKCALASLKAP